jgi:hypothetical protein
MARIFETFARTGEIISAFANPRAMLVTGSDGYLASRHGSTSSGVLQRHSLFATCGAAWAVVDALGQEACPDRDFVVGGFVPAPHERPEPAPIIARL